MKRLAILILLIMGCDNSTAPEECVGTDYNSDWIIGGNYCPDGNVFSDIDYGDYGIVSDTTNTSAYLEKGNCE